MDKSNLRNKRLKKLNRGKLKSLGIIEKISMKYAGWVDGRNGFLRCDINGVWQSSILKHEVDSYEEFLSTQFGLLKVEEEDEFKQLNILFDKVNPLRKKLSTAQQALSSVLKEELDLTLRKEGEENLTETHITARRNRERSAYVHSFREEVRGYETQLSILIEDIFERLSQVKESFDSTLQITNRLLLHHQRRVDVYWRSAMYYIPELPAFANVIFSNVSEQKFADHYNEVVIKAEKLRVELENELMEEI
ncbi:MAG: hypothetical protein R3Y24_05360 [Eubacteriales bacterium]